MAEVPEHLLQRSRERRAALGLGGDDTPAASAADAGGDAGGDAPAAAAPATVAATPAPAVFEPEPAPVVVIDPGRPRVPVWMMPVLAMLPVWAFAYLGVFTTPQQRELTPVELGTEVYRDAGCVGCHLADGAGDTAGGVGRQLSDGQVELTFPEAADQIAFVKAGSPSTGTSYGDPAREGGQHTAKGGMPAFGGSLSDEEVAGVVAYEREVLSKK